MFHFVHLDKESQTSFNGPRERATFNSFLHLKFIIILQCVIRVKQSTLDVCVFHLMPVIVKLTSTTHLKTNWKVSEREGFYLL